MLKHPFGSFLLAAALGVAGQANAVLMVYSDFASWSAAAGAPVRTETFESLDFNDPANPGQGFVDFGFFETFGDIIAVAPVGPPANDFIGVSRDFTADAPFLDSNYIAIRSPLLLRVELPAGTRSLGFNFAEQHGKAIEFFIQVNTSSGINTFRFDSSDDAYAFFGAVADEEITGFFFSPTTSILDGDYGVVDNIAAVPFPAVPAPGTRALLLTGIGLLGLRRIVGTVSLRRITGGPKWWASRSA